jgi:DNA repair exonuclease SbcCD nuclease subunit
MEIVWISDLHFGLKTDGINRNEEIFDVSLQAVKKACSLKKSGRDTVMIFGGDIFNTNNPSEDQINLFTKLLAFLHNYNVTTYILPGNHDALFDRERKSCLSFVTQLGKISEHIKLVSDISFLKYKMTDLGDIVLTFLPHITKSNYVDGTYKSTQDYINQKCEGLLKKIPRGSQHYAFSHLNVKGVHPGSEENLLKKSEVYLPECFLTKTIGNELPKIINGHIHTPDFKDNITIVGSPIFCTFGENTDIPKAFLHLHLPETLGDKEEWNFISTDCVIFDQIELDLTQDDLSKTDFFDVDKVKNLLNFKENRKYHLKFDVMVDAKSSSINWDKIREKIEENKLIKVKPITPKIVRNRIVRSKEQALGLNPQDAVKVFLKTNKPKNVKAKWELSKKYLGNV